MESLQCLERNLKSDRYLLRDSSGNALTKFANEGAVFLPSGDGGNIALLPVLAEEAKRFTMAKLGSAKTLVTTAEQIDITALAVHTHHGDLFVGLPTFLVIRGEHDSAAGAGSTRGRDAARSLSVLPFEFVPLVVDVQCVLVPSLAIRSQDR